MRNRLFFTLSLLILSSSGHACIRTVDDLTDTLRQIRDFPGSSYYTGELRSPYAGLVSGQSYWENAELNEKHMVIVCGENLEIPCKNGVYPLDPASPARDEIEEDYFVKEYWNSSSYFLQEGFLSSNEPVAVQYAQVYCGEHYCRIVYSREPIQNLPTYPETYRAYKSMIDGVYLSLFLIWPLVAWILLKVFKKEKNILGQLKKSKTLLFILILNALIVFCASYLLSRLSPMC